MDRSNNDITPYDVTAGGETCMSKLDRSSNTIMWDCFVDILNNSPQVETFKTVDKFIFSYELYKGKEVEYNFSHDNWTLVLCYLHKFYPKDKHLFPSTGNHALHPMRFIKFLWMKYNWCYPLRLFHFLDLFVNYGIIRRKTKKGNYHTTGLLLNYYIAYSYGAKIQMWFLTKLMKTMYPSWKKVFIVYHGNPKHYGYKVLEAFRNKE